MDRDSMKGLEEIHGPLLAEEDLESTLRVVAEIAVRAVSGCHCAGILMEREKCSADEAFEMLFRASQSLNRKLREVAEDVAEDAEGPDHSPEAGKGKL